MKSRKILLILVLLMLFTSFSVKADPIIDAVNDNDTEEKLSDNKLSMIKLDNQELEFFDENVTSYDIEVEHDVESINIEPVKKNDSSSVGGDVGTKTLQYGINTFTINVIGESGVTNTYTLYVTRIDERSTDNNLKSLKITNIDMIFVPNITDYELSVDNKIDKITIESELSDEKAIYEEGFGNREVELNEGSNKVQIKILSESGEEKIYTLNITRALSGNNTLKSLFVNDEKIILKEDEFNYKIEFENEVAEAIIKATPNDVRSTVNIKDKYELEVGDNEINVEIIAANGSKASYVLTVTRKKILSSNSKLSNIKIIGYKINFNKDNTLYNLKIKDEEEKLDIYTVPEDAFATVEIEGNENLVDGSIIKVNVKAEDGTYTGYFINIEKNRKNSLFKVIIAIIILMGLLALCLTILIKRRKKELLREAKIKEEMIDNHELDSVGAEMDIEASDYEEEKNDEDISVDIKEEDSHIDNEKEDDF